jgi:hypothetical protein
MGIKDVMRRYKCWFLVPTVLSIHHSITPNMIEKDANKKNEVTYIFGFLTLKR